MGANTGAGGYPAGGINAGGQGSIWPPPGFDPTARKTPGSAANDLPVTGGTNVATFPGTRPPLYGGPGLQNQANPTGGYMPPRDGDVRNAGGVGSIPPETGGWMPPRGDGDPVNAGGAGSLFPVGGQTGGWMPPRDGDIVSPGKGTLSGARVPEGPYEGGIRAPIGPTGGYMPPRGGWQQPNTRPPSYGGPTGIQNPMPTQGQGLSKPAYQPGPAQPAETGPYKPPQANYPAPTKDQGLTKPGFYGKPAAKPGVGMTAPGQQSPPHTPYKKPELM